MIRGFCMGGGLLTSLSADIRIASDDSQFGVPAGRLGLGYAHAGVETLAGVVGRPAAAEILFSARRFSADEAFHIGLVNRVVDVDELADAVYGLASQIADNAPLTIKAIKASLQELRRPADSRDTGRVAELVDACFRSNDYLEGQAAFAERRPPRFEGR
jgi:enoyl-CoA hydratase/carnithine racemase